MKNNDESYNEQLSFKQQVSSLVENSALFPPKNIGEGKTLSIVDAIEGNEVMLYLPERPSQKMLDAVQCMTSIHDELKKPQPDHEFIAVTLELLRTYL